jgi:hypothetical protein
LTNPLLFIPNLNPNNYYPLLTIPNPTHTQWIISFVLDSIHTKSIICTLPTSSHPISSIDNYFLLIPSPSPFKVGVDLNIDDGKKNNRPSDLKFTTARSEKAKLRPVRLAF